MAPPNTGTASAAFRLLSQPGGRYNTAPKGIFAAGLPAFARGALGAYQLPTLEDPNPRAPLLSSLSPSTASSISSLKASLPTLYEFQACPFCRTVREAATLLALDVLFLPCPKEGVAFRPLAAEAALAQGKQRAQFPLLVEVEGKKSDGKGNGNAGGGGGEKFLFESDAIVKKLFEDYGPSSSSPADAIPWQLRPGSFLSKASLGAAAIARARSGRAAAFKFDESTEEGKKAAADFAASRRAMKPLYLWGYEPSPYCTLVREKLNELEVPHVYCAVPRGAGAKRRELTEKWAATAATSLDPAGKLQVPYLEDQNYISEENGKGAALYETGPILEYLDERYGPKEKKKK